MIEITTHPNNSRQMRLHSELWLPRSREEVFEFFADASNLEAMTPPWLRFHLLTPGPIEMSPGTIIDYRLQLRRVPIRWRSEIPVWEPPDRFVDRQLRGPYRVWEHTHTLTTVNGGTLICDDVRYAVPGGRLVERFLVRPDLLQIFAYRQQRLSERFAPDGPADQSLNQKQNAS